jgi:hypothetical protein
MAITSKDTFDFAMARARHQLALYDILHDNRQRGIRSDWKRNFAKIMHWPHSENIVRIDGKDKNSILVLREELGLSRVDFTHDYVSELLRGAITSSVSALDRYIHDQDISYSLILLRRPEDDIPKELRKLRIPLLTAKRSLEKLRSNGSSRPGSILKADLRKFLHRDQTFQNVSGVERGAQMLGIGDFWSEMASKIPGFTKAKDLQDALRKIAKRRNQIVHEADVIIQERARQPKLRDMTRSEAEEALDFVCEFVSAFDVLANENC